MGCSWHLARRPPRRPRLLACMRCTPPCRCPHRRQTLGAAGIQPNDLIMLMRRAPAAAARGPQQGAAQPAAQQTAGNPAAMNPDGSAVNPELLMQVSGGWAGVRPAAVAAAQLVLGPSACPDAPWIDPRSMCRAAQAMRRRPSGLPAPAAAASRAVCHACRPALPRSSWRRSPTRWSSCRRTCRRRCAAKTWRRSRWGRPAAGWHCRLLAQAARSRLALALCSLHPCRTVRVCCKCRFHCAPTHTHTHTHSTPAPIHALRQDALRKLHADRRKAEEEERRFMQLAESDPFNPEVQVGAPASLLLPHACLGSLPAHLCGHRLGHFRQAAGPIQVKKHRRARACGVPAGLLIHTAPPRPLLCAPIPYACALPLPISMIHSQACPLFPELPLPCAAPADGGH